VTPTIREQVPIVDDILGEQEAVLRLNLAPYRNHVYRMINFCFAFGELSSEEQEKIVIAGCFHDIGIWTAKTFDYLPPSIDAAASHVRKAGRSEWIGHISQMIDQHHKLRRFSGDRLTETFRQGDLVDFSLGTVTCGLDRSFVREVKDRFPNAGFHAGLLRTAGHWLVRHPLNPLPVTKW
jgi:hypothetical protein